MEFPHDQSWCSVMSLSQCNTAELCLCAPIPCPHTNSFPLYSWPSLTCCQEVKSTYILGLSFGCQAEIVDIRVDSLDHWLHFLHLFLLKLLHLDHDELSVQQRPFRIQLCSVHTLFNPWTCCCVLHHLSAHADCCNGSGRQMFLYRFLRVIWSMGEE